MTIKDLNRGDKFTIKHGFIYMKIDDIVTLEASDYSEQYNSVLVGNGRLMLVDENAEVFLVEESKD